MSFAAKQSTALRSLLRANALQTTVTRTVAGTRNPVAQTTAGTANATQPIVCLVTPATAARDASVDDRALVRKNQRHLTIAALKPDGTPLDFELADEQIVTLEGAPWRLAGVSKLAPDGATVVLYEAEARR